MLRVLMPLSDSIIAFSDIQLLEELAELLGAAGTTGVFVEECPGPLRPAPPSTATGRRRHQTGAGGRRRRPGAVVDKGGVPHLGCGIPRISSAPPAGR